MEIPVIGICEIRIGINIAQAGPRICIIAVRHVATGNAYYRTIDIEYMVSGIGDNAVNNLDVARGVPIFVIRGTCQRTAVCRRI